MSSPPPLSPDVGDLRRTPLAEVFRRLHRDRSSGILDLQHDADQRRVFLVGGEVRSAMSNGLGQKVGQHLVAAGLVLPPDVEEALRRKSEGLRLGKALVANGAIDAATLEKELRKLVADIVYTAFAWDHGVFRFVPNTSPVPADVQLSISTANVILEGIRRIPSDDTVRAGIGDPKRPLRLAADPFLRLQHVTLTPDEGYLVSRIDGGTSAEQLLKMGPVPPEKAMRLVYGLIATGIVEPPTVPPPPGAPGGPTGMNVQIAATRRTTAILAPKPEVPASFLKEEIDFRRRKIQKTHQRLRNITSHELLERPLNPTFREIRMNYNARAEIFHPDLAFKPEYADLKKELTEIFRKLEEAYRVVAARYRDAAGLDD